MTMYLAVYIQGVCLAFVGGIAFARIVLKR